MKITYTENPLNTIVELDEFDRKELWYKIKIYELEETLGTIAVNLQSSHQEWYNKNIKPKTLQEFVDDARTDAEWIWEKNENSVDTRVNMLTVYLSEELKGSHSGDCTCVPCSCDKCRAEGVLGINTLHPFPGKHELAKIDAAFRYKDGEDWKQRTLPEALEILKNYSVPLTKPESWTNFTQEAYESHIPRWFNEGKAAYEYMLNYANTHFPNYNAYTG